ncbi:hypothetical protein CEH05_08265 [Halobacillus halophilus]|nr:hypothetical protein CEH05_08265 [Halobacillus halophilus]
MIHGNCKAALCEILLLIFHKIIKQSGFIVEDAVSRYLWSVANIERAGYGNNSLSYGGTGKPPQSLCNDPQMLDTL